VTPTVVDMCRGWRYAQKRVLSTVSGGETTDATEAILARRAYDRP
jgi:hypothetical protein